MKATSSQSQPPQDWKEAAQNVAEHVLHETEEKVHEKTRRTMDLLTGLGHTVRDAILEFEAKEKIALPGTLKRVLDHVDDAANYIERRTPREMAHDAQSFARKEPVYFLGGILTAGLISARFLKHP